MLGALFTRKRRLRLADAHDAVSTPAPPERLFEVYAGDDRHGDDYRGDPVDDHAEPRPPPGVGHKRAAMQPQVFEPVADESDDDWPDRSAYSERGDHNADRSDGALGDDRLRPCA